MLYNLDLQKIKLKRVEMWDQEGSHQMCTVESLIWGIAYYFIIIIIFLTSSYY